MNITEEKQNAVTSLYGKFNSDNCGVHGKPVLELCTSELAV